MESSERSPVLVLGIGNILYGDEGVGVAAAEVLAARNYPGVDVLDGGTLGLSLLCEVEGRDCLLLLDAVAGSEGPPGSVSVLGSQAIQNGFRLCLSAHQLGVSELLATATLTGHAPGRVAAVAMAPASLDLGVGLSAAAHAALGLMVDRAVGVLRDWGVPCHA